MPHYDEFKGKVALITGAGSGIGRTTAIAFAKQGAKVVVSDINPDAGAETVKKITDAGAQALFVATDVSKEDQVQALVAKAVERFGRLDIALGCCWFGGHEDKIVTHEPEGENGKTKVWN